MIGPDEPRPDLTIVVANDDGGSIFATLEQGAEEYAHAYERLFGTPHHVDLAALCQATRTPHWRVDSAAELEHALASPNGGIEVVEASSTVAAAASSTRPSARSGPDHDRAVATHTIGSPQPSSSTPCQESASTTRVRRCAAKVSTWAIIPP